MINWYSFTPADTLFCKGAEPMDLGEQHTASHLFPPPSQTIAGAVRTAVLVQNDISFESYAKGKAPPHIVQAVGMPGSTPPFQLIGPLFGTLEDVFIPTPYHWYAEDIALDKKLTKVIRSKKTVTALINSGSSDLYWAKGELGQLKSLGGTWAKLADVISDKEEITIRENDYFFKLEPRTGIALYENRRVREGHLYTFSHARLNEGVSIVFGINRELPLADAGVFKIGAEQRFGQYRKMPRDSIKFKDQGSLFVALSIIEGTDETNAAVIATGKIMYLGGWDLHKGFHKPMKGYFPPGTVFNKKISNNFLSL